MKYRLQYLAAFYRTQRLGLGVPPLKVSFKCLMNQQTTATLIQEVHREPLTWSDLAHKCIEFHINEIPSVKKAFGVKPVLTTGCVIHNGIEAYQFSTRDIRAYLQGRRRTDRLPFHAWLTLPTMEIIDFTFMASNYAYFLNQGIEPGFIFGSPASLKRELNIVYRPMLLDYPFYEKIGVAQWNNKALLD